MSFNKFYTKVSDNVFTTPAITQTILPGYPAQTSNVTCIVLPENLIFIDCGVILTSAARFHAEMEQKFNKKTTHLLLTHNHWDHIFGMATFKNVKIIIAKSGLSDILNWLEISDKTNILKKQLANTYKFDTEVVNSIHNSKFYEPQITVDDELTIEFDGEEVIFSVIGGHSPDSSSIYYPKDQVLCTGDNLLEYYPPITSDLPKAIEIYLSWEALDVKKIIPGHGRVVDKQYIKKIRCYCERMVSFLQNAKDDELTIKEVLKHRDRPSYFGENQINWIKGGKYHTLWLENMIEGWYKRI